MVGSAQDGTDLGCVWFFAKLKPYQNSGNDKGCALPKKEEMARLLIWFVAKSFEMCMGMNKTSP